MQFTPANALPTHHARLALAASLMVVSGWTHAHFFCASTALEFQTALTQSSDGGIYNGEDNVIFLTGGTYVTGAATSNGPFLYYSPFPAHSIDVYGGLAAACGPRTAQTPPTILDGGGNTGVLTIRNTNGDVTVNQLTLQNGESTQPGAGLQVNYSVSAQGSVNIRRTIIRNNHSTANAGGLYVSSGDQAFLVANLITGNSADGQYGAGTVTGSGQISYLSATTVTQNTSTAATPVGGLYCGGSAVCELHNCILWNNTLYGVYLGNASALLRYNDIGTRGGAIPSADDHNLSVAPQFVNASNGNFRLAGDSPLLGYAPVNGTEFDLDGHQYPLAGKIDLGPYEVTIFIDGFDGN